MEPNPCWYQLQKPTVGPQHSLPDPKPKLTILKVAQKKGWPDVASVLFLNPDPVSNLVRHSNEAPVIVDRQETTTLIDFSVQVSSISSQFCGDLALQIQPLGQLLQLEGTGGSVIPYLGFMEVNLQILGSKTVMGMCCCWSYQPWPTLKWSQSWLDPKSLIGIWAWWPRGSSWRWPWHGDKLI